jgi:uncharacterized protein
LRNTSLNDSPRAGGEGGEPRFFADSMLGKLARWLRTLGFDVEYEKDIDDSELVERAVREGRIILTRDTLLIKRRRIRGGYIFIESDSIGEQLRQLSAIYGTGFERFLTRCLRCNALLEGVPRSGIEDKVPPYVYNTREKFMRCPRCGRIYWAGTHREKMLKALSRLLGRDAGRDKTS